MSRRSGGCAWCRRSKVKCDEYRPSCTRCIRSGHECSYFPKFEFRDENTKFGVFTNETVDLDVQRKDIPSLYVELNVLTSKVTNGLLVQKLQVVRKRSRTPRSKATTPGSIMPTPSPNPQESLIIAFVSALEVGPDGYKLNCLGSFLFEIPSRIGHNPALDAAVACLLQSHTQLLHNTTGNTHQRASTPKVDPSPPSVEYIKALRLLQDVIDDPVLGISSETVCAMMLMSYYEIEVAEKRGHQYVAHAGAATKLVLLRGPGMISTRLERELFRAQRGQMIMQAFLRHEDCVLLQDDWSTIDLGIEERTTCTRLLDRLLAIFSHFPSLAKFVRHVTASPSQENLEIATNLGEFLQQRLASLSADIHKHSSKGELAFTLQPSVEGNQIFPSNFHFKSAQGATLHTWLWSATLILNTYMTSILTYEAHDDAQAQQLRRIADAAARKICMSYEYAASKKPHGAYFLQLPIKCAYAISREDIKEWILLKLNLLVAELHILHTKEYVELIARSLVGKVY